MDPSDGTCGTWKLHRNKAFDGSETDARSVIKCTVKLSACYLHIRSYTFRYV